MFCDYCEQAGHTRENCKDLTDHMHMFHVSLLKWRKNALQYFANNGIWKGALITRLNKSGIITSLDFDEEICTNNKKKNFSLSDIMYELNCIRANYVEIDTGKVFCFELNFKQDMKDIGATIHWKKVELIGPARNITYEMIQAEVKKQFPNWASSKVDDLNLQRENMKKILNTCEKLQFVNIAEEYKNRDKWETNTNTK